MKSIYGKYENSDFKNPTYDPGFIGVPCPICERPLLDTIKTLDDLYLYNMGQVGDTSAYFVRVHDRCRQNAPKDLLLKIQLAPFDKF